MPNFQGVATDEANLTSLNFFNDTFLPVRSVYNTTATLSPSAVGAGTTAEQTFTVTGLAVGDVVFVNKPSAQAGLGIVGARVSAANTLAITFANVTVASITPTASEVYRIGGHR